ncbi:hypothetical protein JF634_01355 [Simonsiella muelleri]|uniref:Lipoprotein n=1 Tax=Simonsiella muelleri ATCC 29453 TaxID=641147 RepID=V9HMM6_9NEIS|nr:hypothetical protein [Simonsiella muelleri]AUX62092.1 hypothetical protein BWP33_09965 [Simonsiella muelleri ATCC 29453]EFG31393.1 hypothetical protein HMPREF9021_00662 [Simonsiella muelleri ATCC 29453]UBQ54185.1 hypothetical protein JF634_01355 [Simonsiella muelleri]
MKKIKLLPFILCLNACVSAYSPQDLPMLSSEQILLFQLDKLDEQGNVLQTSLLSIQGEADGATRWTQTDAFGAPQARFVAKSNGWQRDGFVMPNAEAKRLFTEMLPYVKRGFRQPEKIRNVLITPLENE